jgi:uncharacterized protein (DUF2235 family)
MDSDGDVQVPSNVTRIARAIKPWGLDKDGNQIPQLIFYQNGVGTGSKSLWVKYVGGATGDGLADNIREAYAFICLNYVPGDEIIIIGFSRGAFTARSISSLIRALGLLTTQGMEHFIPIVEDWQFQLKDGWKTKHALKPWPGHAPPVHAPDYQRKLLELELTRPDIPIKAVAVWDTIGGLGIPMIGLLPQPPSTDFSFVDTKVERNIEHAFQALALDERRRTYAPTIWEKPAGQRWPTTLKQCWFPGVHSDIGGSYSDTDLANLTLCWMVSQLDPFIAFEHDYVWRQVRLGMELYERELEQMKESGSAHTPPLKLRPWGLGKIHNSMSFFFRLGGSKVRTPGEYCEPKRASEHGTAWYVIKRSAYHLTLHLGWKEKVMPRLTNTNETIHASVRIRMGKKGLGYDDKGLYDSEALKGWTMVGEESNPHTPHQMSMPGEPGALKHVRWRKAIKRKDEKTGEETEETLIMQEDEMGQFEKMILQLWPDIKEEFNRVLPGGHRQSVARAVTYPARSTSTKLGTPAKKGSRSSKIDKPGIRDTSGSSSGGEGKLTLDTAVNGHVGDAEEHRRPDRVETI